MEYIKILSDQDTLVFENDILLAKADGHEYCFPLESVSRLVIATTDSGPLYDDMALIIQIGKDISIFIMSEHKCYEKLLFGQFGKALPVDHQKIIEASSCVEQNFFEIYNKNPSNSSCKPDQVNEVTNEKADAPRRGHKFIDWISDLFHHS